MSSRWVLVVTPHAKCPECVGTGRTRGGDSRKPELDCDVCDGAGRVTRYDFAEDLDSTHAA